MKPLRGSHAMARLRGSIRLSDKSRQEEKRRREAARKRGPSFLRKACGIGIIADVTSGGFYWEPTHNQWKMGVHIAEGCELPDLNKLFGSKFSHHSSDQINATIHVEPSPLLDTFTASDGVETSSSSHSNPSAENISHGEDSIRSEPPESNDANDYEPEVATVDIEETSWLSDWGMIKKNKVILPNLKPPWTISARLWRGVLMEALQAA